MCQRDPAACIGITAEALTVTVYGKPALLIPRERMLDLMLRIGIASCEMPGRGGAAPPQGSNELKLAADQPRPAIHAEWSRPRSSEPQVKSASLCWTCRITSLRPIRPEER